MPLQWFLHFPVRLCKYFPSGIEMCFGFLRGRFLLGCLDWIGLIVTVVTGSETGGRRVLGSMKGDERGEEGFGVAENMEGNN